MTLRGFTVAVFAVLLPGLVGAFAAAPAPQTSPAKASAEDLEFFEKKVRPILAAQCVPCHSGAQASGKLRLDRFDGLFGADGKPALVTPGSPDKSTLIHAVRYTVPALRMPPSGKLPPEQLATLEDWVGRGAPVPPTTPSAKAAPAASGFSLAKRRQHWAYLPVKPQVVPRVKNTAWVRNPVDAFVLAKLETAGLTPAPPADKRTLLRRVTFDLTGLPPTPSEMHDFLADTRPGAYERQVERLLASPAYGERWARHWLDLVRYGETLGHEYDFDIPNAYQYRDYVVRAFNADVPYDRFVREHVAGDLMTTPRRGTDGRNESIIGTGFWWLAEGKHSPVDVKQEQADRTDNQIDVFGKAFLGQTVACARCHDHKFDPIPTRDYYALYGILAGSHYQQAHVNASDTFAAPMRAMDAVRAGLPRMELAKAWQATINALPEGDLQAAVRDSGVPSPPLPGTIAPLSTWRATGEAFTTFGKPGDLVMTGSVDKPTAHLLPIATADSGLRSRRLEGALRSPTFTINQDFLHLHLSGHLSQIRIIVENFQVIRDPIFGPLSFTVENTRPGWHTLDLRLWKGRRAYVELSDSSLSNLSLDPIAASDRTSDGWLRVDAAVLSPDARLPQSESGLRNLPLAQVRARLHQTLDRWASGTTSAEDTDGLAVVDELLVQGRLDTTLLSPVAAQLSHIESPLPAPTRVVAMCDGDAENETVFLRGNYQTPGAPAPRLQLALFRQENATMPKDTGSGRRELASWLTRPQNPLTARVMVNRLWKQHFGVGIVATPDDFGHMGEKPTHPELLDWLATDFVRNDWSLKAMHRRLVLSSTYRMSSRAANPVVAGKKDPKNALLHQMPIRRLEAEAIRDNLLAVSGRLDRALYGPPVRQFLSSFEGGAGRPASGPLDGNGRRSLYLSVRRNFLSPWMLAFDFPTPFTTIGRRTVSNVPAQALALMNGPFVRQQADVWADRVLKEMPGETTDARVTAMYETALGRLPSRDELQAAREFIGTPTQAEERAAWADLCHVLFNVKEFIFVR